MPIDAPPRRGRPRRLDEESVLAATVKLLHDHGPVGVTVRSVAEAVGVSRQVVYTQFGSLGGLIDAVYRHGFDQLRAGGARSTSHPASNASWPMPSPTGGTRWATRSSTR